MDTLDLGLEMPAKRSTARQEALSAIHRHNLTLKAEIYSAPVGDMPRAVFARSFGELIRVVTLAPCNPEGNDFLLNSLDSLSSQLLPADVVAALNHAVMRLPSLDSHFKIDPHVIQIQTHGRINFATSGSVIPLVLVRRAAWWHKANLEFPIMPDQSSAIRLKSGDILVTWSGDHQSGQRFRSEMEKIRDPLTTAVIPGLDQIAGALSKSLATQGANGNLVLVRYGCG